MEKECYENRIQQLNAQLQKAKDKCELKEQHLSRVIEQRKNSLEQKHLLSNAFRIAKEAYTSGDLHQQGGQKLRKLKNDFDSLTLTNDLHIKYTPVRERRVGNNSVQSSASATPISMTLGQLNVHLLKRLEMWRKQELQKLSTFTNQEKHLKDPFFLFYGGTSRDIHTWHALDFLEEDGEDQAGSLFNGTDAGELQQSRTIFSVKPVYFQQLHSDGGVNGGGGNAWALDLEAVYTDDREVLVEKRELLGKAKEFLLNKVHHYTFFLTLYTAGVFVKMQSSNRHEHRHGVFLL